MERSAKCLDRHRSAGVPGLPVVFPSVGGEREFADAVLRKRDPARETAAVVPDFNLVVAVEAVETVVAAVGVIETGFGTPLRPDQPCGA